MSETTHSRRAALRSMFTAGAAIAATSALTAASALATPALETQINRDADLIAIGKRCWELHLERKVAAAERMAALDRFKDMAPKYQPKHRRAKPSPYHSFDIERERRVYDVEGGKCKGMAISVDQAYDELVAHPSKLPEGQFVRRMLGVSKLYERKLNAAAQESGYAAAEVRLNKIDDEIMQSAPLAFNVEPSTIAGIAAQAQALLAIPRSRSIGFAENKAHEARAEAMARAAIRVAGIEAV